MRGNMVLIMEEEIKNRECPQCGSKRLVYDSSRGEKVCSQCGLVITEVIVNRGPEWRAFTLKERAEKNRTGAPTSYTLYDKGLNTIFWTRRDAYGKRLNPEKRWKMRRLRRYDVRSKLDESKMRNLSRAMAELNILADELHLPKDVRERAAVFYRGALKEDLIKGRSIACFVAASLYAACRQMEIPRSLNEVSEASMEEHRDVARTYRLLIKELKLKMPVDYPMKFVPKIASKMDISRETDRLTVRILREARNKRALVGKDPRGLAAAALYMACKMNDEEITQENIAEVAGITEVTLRNRLRGLEKIIDREKLEMR